MDVQTLIDKRAELWHNVKNYLEEHTDTDGKMSPEDVKTYEKMEAELIELGKSIDRFERQAVLKSQLESVVNPPILMNPNAKMDGKVGRASDEYRQAALAAVRNNFKTVSNYLQESVDASGGYLVPAEWDSRLISALVEDNVMRQLGTTITTSGEHKINVAGTKPTAAWVDEGEALSFSDAKFSQVTLDAHKLHVGIQVTNELLYDNAYNLESYLIEKFAEAIAEKEEDAFLNDAATETGKPKGLFAMAAADSDSVVTTASSTSITADNIIDLVYNLKRPYRRNAVFIMNDKTLATIRKLKNQNGEYMWQPSYQGGEPDTLLGYKVYTSAYAPTIAAGKAVIAFGDMSYYNIADRGVRSFRELRELYAGNDKTGFLMLERVDGALILPEAVRILKMKA